MKRILIVDDDPNIRELLELRLQSNGYEVSEASNGIEAFAKVIDERPDLIMLDVSMPVFDGYQFVKEVRWREEFKNIPILIVTGSVLTKDMFNVLGVDHFLTKPFDTQEMLGLVNESVM